MVMAYNTSDGPMWFAAVRLFAADTAGDSISYRLVDSTTMAGYYEVRAPQAGDYRLVFGGTGYRQRTVDLRVSRDTTVDQRLMSDSATGEVRVRVRRGFEDIAACSVAVVALDSAGDTISGTEASGVTDATGTCRIPDIALTQYGQSVRVTASCSGFVCAVVTVPLWEGAQSVRLDPGAGTPTVPPAVVLRDGLQHTLSAITQVQFGDTTRLIEYALRNLSPDRLRVPFDRICMCPAGSTQNCSFGFVALAPDGDTVLGEGHWWAQCDRLPWERALAPGESITMVSPILPSDTTADTATVFAWLYGQQPDTALHIGVRFAPASSVTPRARSGRSPLVSISGTVGGHVRLTMGQAGKVSLSVLALDGRLVSRPVQQQPCGAGVHDVQLRSGARGVRVLQVDVDGRRRTVVVAEGL